VSPLVELGWRDGELLAPRSAVSSRGLESLLRRYTLPVRAVQHFDALPIPFRAVATDMETGAAVVMDQGDLALALRSSMSVPGVFSPTVLGGRVLGDGGLVNNLPIDVARAGRRHRDRRQHRHAAGRAGDVVVRRGPDDADAEPAHRAERSAQPGHPAPW
jgi:NTE family protein